MKLTKVNDPKCIRIPIADGSYGDENFVISVISDGSGILVEFEDDEAYQLSAGEIIAEIIKIKGRQRKMQRKQSLPVSGIMSEL